MDNLENPNKKFETILKESDLVSLSKDFGEVAIDNVMDEGILRDIPVLGTVVGLIKFGNTINKYTTAKKIYRFLLQLHKIPVDKRLKKIEEINASEKYRSSVGEMILELLDRIESDGKPEIIGRLMAAVIEETIDYRTYLKCAHIIKKTFYYDLEDLKNVCDGEVVKGEINDEIFNSGLIDHDFTSDYNDIKGGNYSNCNTRLSELGSIIVMHGMKQ